MGSGPGVQAVQLKLGNGPVGVVGFEELRCDVSAKFAIALPLQLIKPLVGRALVPERRMLAMIVDTSAGSSPVRVGLITIIQPDIGNPS